MKNDAQSGDYDEGEKSAQRRACGVRVSFMTKEGRTTSCIWSEDGVRRKLGRRGRVIKVQDKNLESSASESECGMRSLVRW